MSISKIWKCNNTILDKWKTVTWYNVGWYQRNFINNARKMFSKSDLRL